MNVYILLMISQHWFRWWLGAVRQQAITWANVDPDLCCHMASLGHSELSSAFVLRKRGASCTHSVFTVYVHRTPIIAVRQSLTNSVGEAIPFLWNTKMSSKMLPGSGSGTNNFRELRSQKIRWKSRTLKVELWHDVKFVVTCGTAGCRYDNC